MHRDGRTDGWTDGRAEASQASLRDRRTGCRLPPLLDANYPGLMSEPWRCRRQCSLLGTSNKPALCMYARRLRHLSARLSQPALTSTATACSRSPVQARCSQSSGARQGQCD